MSLHDSASGSGDTGAAGSPVLLFVSLFLPLIPSIAVVWVLPRYQAMFADLDTELPVLTQIALSPGAIPAITLMYGIQMIALIVCWQSRSMRRFVNPVALLSILLWGTIGLATIFGVFLPLIRLIENL